MTTGRYSQVVRRLSAKQLYGGSIPPTASTSTLGIRPRRGAGEKGTDGKETKDLDGLFVGHKDDIHGSNAPGGS